MEASNPKALGLVFFFEGPFPTAGAARIPVLGFRV